MTTDESATGNRYRRRPHGIPPDGECLRFELHVRVLPEPRPLEWGPLSILRKHVRSRLKGPVTSRPRSRRA